MPQAYVKKLAKKKGMAPEEADRRWKKAQAIAGSKGKGKDYAYITGIFKKMMSESMEEMLKYKLVTETDRGDIPGVIGDINVPLKPDAEGDIPNIQKVKPGEEPALQNWMEDDEEEDKIEEESVEAPASFLTEGYQPAVWSALREAVRNAARRDRGADLDDVKKEMKAKWSDLLEFAQSGSDRKPSKNEILKAIEIVADETGMNEHFLGDNIDEVLGPTPVSTDTAVRYIWTCLVAAWETFESGIAGKMFFASSSGVYVVTPVVVAVLLGVVAYLTLRIGETTLKTLVGGFFSWIYRAWKLVDVKLTRVTWPGDRKLLLFIEEGGTYRFSKPVTSRDAFHPNENPEVIKEMIPFSFIKYVKPRWVKQQFLLVIPKAGRLEGEEQIVEIDYIEFMENLDGVTIRDLARGEKP